MAKTNPEIELIKKDLFETDHAKVVDALKRAREMGNHSLIEPMLTLYAGNSDEVVKAEIKDMLSTLKVSKAQAELEAALVNPSFAGIKADVLSFLWNSGMNPVGSMRQIVHAAIDGDFMTALEALTLLESLTGPFDEAVLMESVLALREALEDRKNDDKRDLLRSCFQLLHNLQSAEE